MDPHLELLAVVCGIIGALEISYVESMIMAKAGFQPVSLCSIYWRQLSLPERCLFWTGLPMLIAPIFIALIAR